MSSPRLPLDRPFVGTCAFCRDGILRYWTCSCCSELSVRCNVCGSLWKESLAAQTGKQASGKFPECPKCFGNLLDGHESDCREINANGLIDTIVGYYDSD